MAAWTSSGDAPMSRRPHRAYRVSRVVAEERAGVTLILDGAMPAQPGQFVMVWLPGIGERPFSLMDDDPASLTVARVGPFTEALCALGPGDRLWLRGPYGRGFRLVGRRHLLVSGGCGAVPLALLARQARAEGHEVMVALGARRADLLMLGWRFQELGLPVILATDDGSAGCRGSVLDAVQKRLDARWPEAVYGCGPEPMLMALARRCQELSLPCWVSMERVMKCGLGVCGSCHLGDRLVCRDGPVFEGSEVLELRWAVQESGTGADEVEGT